MVLDIIVFFSPIIMTLTVTLLFSISTMKKSKNLATSLVKSTLLNLTLFVLASIGWFFYETVGFGQLIGWGIYAGCFVLIVIIDATVLVVLRKRGL